MIPVASARMYSWSPTLTAAWRRLLEWVVAHSGGEVKVLELADPYPLEELWARDDLGCVFMCGYPWAMREKRPHLLAVPVPAPPRYRDRPIYFTDFVVRADSPYRTLEDTFSRRRCLPARIARWKTPSAAASPTRSSTRTRGTTRRGFTCCRSADPTARHSIRRCWVPCTVSFP